MNILHNYKNQEVDYFMKGLVYCKKQDLKKLKPWWNCLKKHTKLKSWDKAYVITTEKKSLDWCKESIEQVKDQTNSQEISEKVVVFVLGYMGDSMITYKYIKQYVGRGRKQLDIDIRGVEFSERDRIARIEDDYNDTFSYRYLSKAYKSILIEVTEVLKNKEKTISGIRAKEVLDADHRAVG